MSRIVLISGLLILSQFTVSTTYAVSDRLSQLENRIAKLEKQKQHHAVKGDKSKKNDSRINPVHATLRYGIVPPYNQALAMLKTREKTTHGIGGDYPRVELGGSIIGVGRVRVPPKVAPDYGRTQSDLNLAGANFNINSEINRMLLGSLRVSYNPNGPQKIDNTSITTRVSNSSIFLNTAFLTLGDLDHSPFYMSGGQMFLPFGEYNSSLLFAPTTARLGRFRERPLLFGFQQPGTLQGFNGSVFLFRGDTFTPGKRPVISNGGANLAFSRDGSLFKWMVGTSYIQNIADSGGMQITSGSTIVTDAGEYEDDDFLEDEEEDDIGPVIAFRGFGANGLLVHQVPAYDGRARIEIVPLHVTFYGEVVRPTGAFNIENMSFNDMPATPKAWNAEGAYKFHFFNRETTIAVGYGRSSQALALNMPLYSISGAIRMKVQKFVNLALGYQFDSAYPLDSDATGQELPVGATRVLGTNTRTAVVQVNAKF